MQLISRRGMLAGMALIAAPARAQVVSPAGRAHMAAAYDDGLGAFVIYGGYVMVGPTPRATGELWGWNGTQWRLVANTGTARVVPGLAYDSRRGRLVMFGGFGDGERNNGTLSVLDGNAWKPLAYDPTMARGGAAMVYDRRRDRMVMFGGRNGQIELADTWEFDGEKWNQTWMAGPSLRDPTAMVYDSDRGVCVLYGGFRPLAGLHDTWEWDGHAWRAITEAGPGSRAWPGMAYDARRKRTILFGGEDENGHFFNDTWAWDGKLWSKIADDGPPPRIQFAMGYDPARDRIVAFGGQGLHGYLADTWEFDGTRWLDVSPK